MFRVFFILSSDAQPAQHLYFTCSFCSSRISIILINCSSQGTFLDMLSSPESHRGYLVWIIAQQQISQKLHTWTLERAPCWNLLRQGLSRGHSGYHHPSSKLHGSTQGLGGSLMGSEMHPRSKHWMKIETGLDTNSSAHAIIWTVCKSLLNVHRGSWRYDFFRNRCKEPPAINVDLNYKTDASKKPWESGTQPYPLLLAKSKEQLKKPD